MNIEPISYTFQKDYRTKTLSRVLVKQNSPQQFEYEGNYCFCKETKYKIIQLISKSKEDDVLCIQSKTLDDKEILTEIEAATGRGVNVYLVLHSINSEIRNRLKNKAQVRWGVDCSGSFVLLNQTEGILFQGKLNKDLNLGLYYSLFLEEKQVEDLFWFFCHLFWNKATESLLEGTKLPPSPYGEIGLPPRIYPIENLKNLLQMQNGFISLQELKRDVIESDSILQSKFFVSALGNEDSLLESLAQENEIYFSDSEKPNLLPFALSDKEGFFILNLDGEINYIIILTENQLREFQTIFQKKVKSAMHQFFSEIQYNYIQHDFKFYKEDKYRKIENFKNVPLKLTISLADLKQLRDSPQEIIETLFQRAKEKKPELNEPYALEVTYNLEAKPFFILKNSEKDKLQKDWENIQNKYQQKIEEIIQTSNKIDELKKGLTERVWGALKGLFAGKEQKKSERQRELEELKIKNIMYDAQRQRYVQNLNEIIEAINKDFKDVSEQIHLEQLKEKLENEKKKIQTEIEKIKETQNQKRKNLENLATEIAQELSLREERLKEAKEEEKKKLEKEIETYKASQQQEKTKLENEIKNLQSQIEKLNVKLQNLRLEDIKKQEEQAKASTLLSKSNKSENPSSSKFSIQPFQVSYPNEEPPAVGVLHTHEGKRYLVIQTWEEFEKAKQEAERLKSTLCVME